MKHTSLTPYNYSFNNPTCPPEPWRRRIAFADPSGADPDPEYQNPNHQYYFHNGAGSAGYPGLTYDDVVPQSARGEFNSAFGWRHDTMLGWFAGAGNMGAYWHPGDRRLFWSGYESYARGLRHDADAVRFGHMSLEDYGSRNGTSISVDQLRYMAYAHNHGVNPVTGVRYTFMPSPSAPRLHVNSLNVAFAKVTLQRLPTTNFARTTVGFRAGVTAQLAAYSKALAQYNSYDIWRAIDEVNMYALSKPSKYCARYVRWGIDAGGLDTSGTRPTSAKDYGPYLLSLGFTAVATAQYLAGDIVVFDAIMGFKGVKDHPDGHIQMFNGSQWVSDYRQSDFWPGTDYSTAKPGYQVYRWELKWPNQ